MQSLPDLLCPAKDLNGGRRLLCGPTAQKNPHTHHDSCIRLLVDNIDGESSRLRRSDNHG